MNMARARIADEVGESSVRAAITAGSSRDTTATAVRYLLQLLSEQAPGNTVEVRVPPFGAVQAIEGPRHTRGTPPNVIEMDAPTWLALATGAETWSGAIKDGRVAASGSRADLTGHLPILRMRE
jgi:Bacterial SCP ortholog